MNDPDSLRGGVEKALKLIADKMEIAVTELKEFASPQLRDDFDKLHAQLLFYSAIERDLSQCQRDVLLVKSNVDVHLARAKSSLEDAKMEEVGKSSFRSLTPSFQSRSETDGKLRALTFEEVFEVTKWEEIRLATQYLLDVVRTYQLDANKYRRDIETRLKIISLQI